MRPCLIVAAVGAIAAAQEKEARPWLAGFERSFPCDVLFVKGKKVAGTFRWKRKMGPRGIREVLIKIKGSRGLGPGADAVAP
jgi:hypothetical protein